jgi:5'-deoxynucleotidase YfbR-like HD superfamily hydrolase
MITEIRRGYNVKRFHTTYRSQEETVGHHSANVAALLLALHPDVSRNALVAALMHDVPEGYTGDIPAPVKWAHPELAAELNAAEMAHTEDIGLPTPHLSPSDIKWLKLADMLDLVLSSIEEVGRGNLYAKELERNGKKYIADMKLSQELQIKVNAIIRGVTQQWEQTTSK